MLNPFTKLFPSKEEFAQMGSAPKWKAPYFAVVLGLSLLTWLKSCLRGTSLVANLSVFGAAFISLSISLFVIWSILALSLYLSSAVFNPGKKTSYRSLFSLVSFCGIIFLFGEMLNFILLRMQIIKIGSYILPNRFPIGLDFFLIGRYPSLPLAIFLHSINPIILWYFAALSLGLYHITGMSKNSARLTAFSIWAIGVGSIALIASALGGTTIGVRIG